MADPNLQLVTLTEVSSASILQIPVGPPPSQGQALSHVQDGGPCDSYICTGILGFDFASNNGPLTGIITESEFGPGEQGGIRIYSDFAHRKFLSIVDSLGRHKAINKGVTVSLAGINNDQDDNGIWTVETAVVDDVIPEAGDVRLKIIITVQGASGIRFQRLSYSAFLQVSAIA